MQETRSVEASLYNLSRLFGYERPVLLCTVDFIWSFNTSLEPLCSTVVWTTVSCMQQQVTEFSSMHSATVQHAQVQNLVQCAIKMSVFGITVNYVIVNHRMFSSGMRCKPIQWTFNEIYSILLFFPFSACQLADRCWYSSIVSNVAVLCGYFRSHLKCKYSIVLYVCFFDC